MTAELPPLPTATFELAPTDDDVAFFAENGYVSVPRITTDEEVEWLGVVYDLLFEEKTGTFKGGYFDLARPYDAEGDDLLPQVLAPEHRFPQLRETVYLRNAAPNGLCPPRRRRGSSRRVGAHDPEAGAPWS